MEISNLLGKINHKEKQLPQFLALVLTDDIIQAAVWQVVGEVTEVVSVGTPIPWNGDTGNLEELITAVDTSITSSIKQDSSTPTQIIFGIPTSWISDNSIKTEKKAYIKKICSDLELNPLGFVVVMDSLVRYLRMQEGTPSTAILIQVADTELTLASVVLGKTHATKILARTDDVTRDVEEGLSHCVQGLSQLPSRFIVFDGMHDLEEVVQNLTLVEWTSKFPFVHIPKIEALSKDVVIKAICVAGGAEVARSIGFTIKDIDDTPKPLEPESKEVDDQDQAEVDIEELHEDHEEIQESSNIESLGFSTTDIEEDEAPIPTKKSFSFALPTYKLPSYKLPKLSLPNISISPLHKFPLWATVGIVITSIIFFAIAASLFFFPKADVTISLTPNTESVEFTVKLDPESQSVDESTLTLPVASVETTVSESGSIATTGTKEIGDPSKGEVVIFNRTSQQKTFSKGTILTSSKLKFTLDSEVVVASKSAGADYVDVPGKKTATITALAIGDSGNLKSGSEFVIGTFSQDSYIGKNEVALKGGTSQNVAAVSAQDRENLLKDLTEKLEVKAKEQLESEGDLIYILPDSMEVTDSEYSSKVGAEAKELEATITVNLAGYALSRSSVAKLAQNVLTQKLGNVEFLETPSLELQGGDKESVNVLSTAKTLPRIDELAIKNSLRGVKDAATIEQIVGSVEGFSGIKVSITPTWMPAKLKSLPRKAENINLVIVPSN